MRIALAAATMLSLCAFRASAEPAASDTKPLSEAPATRTRCHGTWGHGIQCDTIAAKTDEQKRAEKLRKDTGALVAEGKCDDAKAMALKAGDFDLAKEIAGYCATNGAR